jgi:DNA-binding NtrC family response regulator
MEPTLTPKVLWIADDEGDVAIGELFSIVRATTLEAAADLLGREEFDVVLVSWPQEGWRSAATLLEQLQSEQPGTPVVVHGPVLSTADCARLCRAGAFHVFLSGDATSLLYMAARSKWDQDPAPNGEREPWLDSMVGGGSQMEQVVKRIRVVAPRNSTVLITGETGTGKEMVARAIHAASARARVPMVAVNCSALPENLLEAELFGHVKGAFTGAVNARIGRFEQANRGTIFLDEIGDMPLNLQAKLLRVLQERELQRLGSSETIRVDVRVISATNMDLDERIKQGRFREDLYYRLNVVPISVPPLRARSSDVAPLTIHFMEKICRRENIPVKQISRETLERLAGYDWPGNVRQLENAVEKAIVLSGERRDLYASDFALSARQRPVPHTSGRIAVPDQGLDFERTVCSIEKDILDQALRKTRGNKKLAAEMLGLKRTTLSAKLKSLVAAGAAG